VWEFVSWIARNELFLEPTAGYQVAQLAARVERLPVSERAALDRWRIHDLYHDVGHDILASYLFLLAIVGYDLRSSHKIHRCTVWGGLVVVLMTQMRGPIGSTAAWQSLARRVQWWNL
jgi:hypothetical protein